MDKFFKAGSAFLCMRNHGAVLLEQPDLISFKSEWSCAGWPECTREEFTAAALQAIEKLKAQGIDIGTDWLPKWEPKVGEVVCAWDNRNGEGFIVAKFVGKSDGIFPYTLSNNYAYQYIAPFTGEIPEPFKSRWEAEGNDPA
jgi:hypothetical protein